MSELKFYKMKKTPLLFLLLVTTVSFAQKMKVTKGDFSFLAGQKDIKVGPDSSMPLYTDRHWNAERDILSRPESKSRVDNHIIWNEF